MTLIRQRPRWLVRGDTNDPLAAHVRDTWTAGDFGRIAVGCECGAAEFVTRLGISAGQRVLDAGCGTGNVAIPAAHAGAVVTAIDIAPALAAATRARAAAEGVVVNVDVGNVERLPYADRQFDVVVSMFGAMFAARPDDTAAELARVCRPGGRVALASWTPDGFMGGMLRITREHVPAPTDVPSPVLWGMEEVVRRRFTPYAHALQLVRRNVTFEYSLSPAQVVELFRDSYGPVVRAYAALDARGQQRYHAALTAHWESHDRARDGTTRVESEYLEATMEVW